jgi:8-oxo-dGTP diphosphatase
MNIRFVSRVITLDKENQKILLVRNSGQDFWSPPGGGWEYEKENIIEGALREVEEETGLKVKILRLIYLQEYHEDKYRGINDWVFLEAIWLAEATQGTDLNELHVDKDADGEVEEVRWFSKEELRDVKVYPERIKNTFWENQDKFIQNEDPFIGVV